jgi:anti-anti-sigma factor
MNFSIIDDDGDVIRVRCEGDLANTDSQESNQLKNLLGPERMKRKVLMNLEKVRFLDSSGISWLLACHKHLVERGGKLVLHDVPPLVRQPLEFTRLNLVLPIASDESAARKIACGADHD